MVTAGAGLVRRLGPTVAAIGRRNQTAGRIAYGALSGAARGVNRAAPIAGRVGKALPYAGAAFTAFDAYGNFNEAQRQGVDPGRAAFMGIGSTLGGFGGGLAGGAAGTFAGPVGTLAGGIGGGTAGGAAGGQIGGAIYDYLNPNRETPLPKSSQAMTIEEQRAMREQIKARRAREQPVDNRLDLGGFKYSKEIDPALVAIRLQQQGSNIANIQGISRDKLQINRDYQATMGQQGVDKYGIGQMYMTDRYRAGLDAGVENNRTRSSTQLGLGDQYTRRFIEGKGIDANLSLGRDTNATQRAIAESGYRTDLAKTGLEYGDRDKERGLRRYQGDQDYQIRNKQTDGQFAVGALATLAGFYR